MAVTLEDGLLGPGAHQVCASLIRDTYHVPGLVLGDPRLACSGKMFTKAQGQFSESNFHSSVNKHFLSI